MIHELLTTTDAQELNLPFTDDYKIFKYINDDNSTVYFSATQQGNAMAIHLAADRQGKKHLREAVNEFCQMIFNCYPWCEVILGIVGKQSIVNLANKCGFSIINQEKIKHNGKSIIITIVGRWKNELC